MTTIDDKLRWVIKYSKYVFVHFVPSHYVIQSQNYSFLDKFLTLMFHL